MKNLMVLIAIVAALTLVSVCYATVATAGTAQFQFGLAHSDSVTSNHHRLATRFAELTNKYSDGRITVTVYPAGQMGNLKTVVEGLQIGSHDLVRTLDVIAALLPETDVFNLPYLFQDRKRFERAIADPLVEKMLDKYRAKGIVIVSWWENGFRHMTNNKRPIRKPEDLRGLKMRTPPNPVRIEMFRLFGGNPAPLPYEELYSALQQGVFDGQENPLNNIRTSKFQEVQKYLSLTAHVYNPQWLAMSRIKWDALPEWGKAAIKKAGDEVGQTYRAEGQALDDDDLNFS